MAGMTKAADQTWRAEAALVLVVLVWGVNFPIVKAVLEVMDPFVLNSFRFATSAIVLGALYARQSAQRGQPFWKPLRNRPLQIAGLGILGFLVYQLCFILGLDRTTAGNAALIMAGSPLWTAVAGFALRTEVLQRRSWFALIIVLIGAVIIVLGGEGELDFSSETFVGNVIMLAAAMAWGVYTALNKPALGFVSATGLTFLGLLVALPFLFALGVPYYSEVAWNQVTMLHWGAILFSGGLATGIAIVLWNNAVKRVGASQTAVYGNIVPIVAVGSSYMMLGETITSSQVVGGLFVIGGILVMRRASRVAAAPG
jgi:drug/metabolite transporter (DMT)-like permease